MIKAIIISKLKQVEGDLDPELILIPKPKLVEYSQKGSIYTLSSNSLFHTFNLENSDLFLKDLNEFLSQIYKFKLARGDNIEDISMDLNQLNSLDLLEPKNVEAYNLEIRDGRILIIGTSERGIFYGLQTLFQLIKNAYIKHLSQIPSNRVLEDPLSLPEIIIKDTPDLKIRGIAQDISRGQVCTLDNAKRYLKIISHYKMNFYCLYMEDMFIHPKHPEIGKNRGALTCEEVKELDKYAKERFIELVPIFECLGHVDNILQHEEYQKLGEFPGAHSFDISNPQVLEFLEDYISKMSDCFSTKYFHVGCDESFDIGRFNSKELIEREGKSKALIEYYEKVYRIAKNCGYEKVIMYDDIVRKNPEILLGLTKKLILMYWDYTAKKSFPDLEKLLEAGYQVIISPSMLNWQRHFPDNKNASKNIIYFTKAAYEARDKGCLGILNSTWGDMRYYSLRENEIFGALLSGAVAWNTLNFDFEQFKKDQGFLFYGFKGDDLTLYYKMFTKLSKSATLYYRVSLLLPPLFFTYFFKHPFHKEDALPLFDNYKKLGQIGRDCLSIQRRLQTMILFEKEHFDYLIFSAKLVDFLEKKIDLSIEVSKILNQNLKTDEEMNELVRKIEKMIEEIKNMRDEYETLWLKAAKRPCLDNILNLFDFLIKQYQEKIQQIKNNIYFVNPYLKSEWIWSREREDALKPRYFQKEFTINQPIKKAILQGIAVNHMEIHVNGKHVGEVLSRYSMSLLPILNRVKTFDITKFLEEGNNIITIKARNYDGYKGAINLLAQIQLQNNEMVEIYSNQTWMGKVEEESSNHDENEFSMIAAGWKPVFTFGPPPNLNGDIFHPNLLEGESSFTQDYFGIESYFSNFSGETKEETLEKMIKELNPYGN